MLRIRGQNLFGDAGAFPSEHQKIPLPEFGVTDRTVRFGGQIPDTRSRVLGLKRLKAAVLRRIQSGPVIQAGSFQIAVNCQKPKRMDQVQGRTQAETGSAS